MNIKRSKVLKYLITGCIGFMFMLAVSNVNNVYASGITFSGPKSIEVYQDATFYVSYETKANNWSVYTKNNGKDSAENNVLKVWKHSYKNGHTGKSYADIKCHAKNAGTSRIYVRDGVTGVVAYMDITVTRRDITRSSIALSQINYSYNGDYKTPRVLSVNLNGTPIENYRVRYSNNKNAGTATVYVDGLGNNCGTAWRTFRIYPINISNNGGMVKFLKGSTVTYTGGRVVPTPFEAYIHNGATRLYYQQDFTYSTPNGDTKAEKKVIRINGIGNYYGSFDVNYIIARRDISKGYVTLDYNTCVYTGNKMKPEVKKVTLSNGTTQVYDYRVEYGENTYANRASYNWVKVHGTGNNTGTIVIGLTIKFRDISGGRIELKDSYSKKKAITKNDIAAVYTKSGTKFYDYEIENSVIYSNNKKATITIRGTGNNTGRITQTFNLDKVDAFLAKAAEIQEYMFKNNYTYAENGPLTIDYKQSQKPGAYGYHHVVCATLVSWSLIESGIMEPWELQQVSDNAHQASVSNFNHTKKFNEISRSSLGRSIKASDIKAGDVLIYGSNHHHVEIAADNGRNYVFNAGGDAAITGRGSYLDRQKNYSTKSFSAISDIDVILRLK